MAETKSLLLRGPATVVALRLYYNLASKEYSIFLELSAGGQHYKVEFADISHFYLNGLVTGMNVDLQVDNRNGSLNYRSADGKLELTCQRINCLPL